MIRNLKVLGLSLVAIFAMSAMVASAASAATNATTTNGAAIEAEDTGNIKFTITGQTVECQQGIFTGTAPAASFTELTVKATFNSCKGAGFEAQVTGFGSSGACDFTLHINGTNDLNCSSGDVTIDAATCIVHIPAQKGLGTTTYTNGTDAGTGKKDLTIDLNVGSITATHTDGFLCPFNGTAEGATAILEGSVTAKATAGGNPVDLSVD